MNVYILRLAWGGGYENRGEKNQNLILKNSKFFEKNEISKNARKMLEKFSPRPRFL